MPIDTTPGFGGYTPPSQQQSASEGVFTNRPGGARQQTILVTDIISEGPIQGLVYFTTKTE